MLKAQQYIEPERLQRWVHQWDEKTYTDYYENQIQDRLKKIKVRSSMEETIVKIKKLCADIGEEGNFQDFLKLMNRIIFNCYFKMGNSAMHMANFYEEILVPADQHTRNRIYGYLNGQQQVGQLQIFFQNQQVGHLGEPSDMFHLIFDAEFMTEEELFDEDAALLDHEESPPPFLVARPDESQLTVKIWKPENLNMGVDAFVDLFLYHCSTKLELNFKRAAFDAPLDRRIEPLDEDIQISAIESDALPLLYFNSAAHNLPPQIIFMSYYHVMSYYFDRAVHSVIRSKMQNMFHREDLDQSQQLKKMAQAVYSLKESFSEKESLALVLKPIAIPENLVRWLDQKPFRKRWHTQAHDNYKQLPPLSVTSEKELLHSLVERIYSIKATLSAEREKQESFIWLQDLNAPLLQRETALLKWLAARTLEHWSRESQS